MSERTQGGQDDGDGGAVGGCCCQVESVVTVDERGQMVLPKEIRQRAGIRPGEKLALVTWDRGEDLCCISLVKVSHLTGMVQSFLGPMMTDMLDAE